MPSVALQARENDAVGGDADEEERSGRGGVDGGAVVVLQEAELDGTSMKLAVGVFKAQAAMSSFVAHRALAPVGIGAPGR